MIWEILKYSFLALIAWIIWSKIIKETFSWLRLRRAGIVFMPGFPPITDLVKLGNEMSDPTTLPLVQTIQKYLGNPLPDYTGMILLGTTLVFVNKAELLEDFYVKKNMYYTKSLTEIGMNKPIMKHGPFVQRSEDPQYAPQRKILSQAFFKNKMKGMIEIIKSTTIDLTKKIRKEYKDGDKIDLIPTMIELMSTLIVNVCVGHGRAYDTVDYKKTDGTVEKITLYEGMVRAMKDLSKRPENPLNLIFPALNFSIDYPWDSTYKFNIDALRAKLRSFVDERLTNPKSNEEFDDILQYLLKDEYYSKNDHEIVDIIFSFFLAGSVTQQNATTNMLYYMEMYPQYKKELLDIILPVTDKMTNLQEELTIETVEDFDYIRKCFNETMRLEPPAFISGGGCFDREVTIGGVKFDAEQTFMINMTAIHNDPRQWREPEVFNPERFDATSEWFKRPDGGVRSPFAFAPFLGGKRICLGKSLVDMTQKFTIPILYSAFDFKFNDPETQSKKKIPYMIGSKELPKHEYKLIYRREL